MPRFVDLSAPITASPPGLPEPLRTDLAVQHHADGAARIPARTGAGTRAVATAGT